MVDRCEPERVAAGVDEPMRCAGRGDDDIAGVSLHLRGIDDEPPGAGMHDEDLLVGMAMQVWTVASWNVYQDQRQFGAVIFADKVTSLIGAWQLACVGQQLHMPHCNRRNGRRAVSR